MTTTFKEQDKFYPWSVQSNYAMALLCWSNSLMNAYKFPELFHKYGNIQIIVPYLIVTLLLIMPLAFTELTIGQFSNCGLVNVWRMTPALKGIAWSSAAITLITANCAFYVTVHAAYYLGKSFEISLPWSKCDSSWATSNCYNAINPTLPINDSAQDSVEHFYKQYVLSESALKFSEMNLSLLLITFLIMLLVGFILFNRIRTLEKILNILSVAPFLLLITLTITSILNRNDFTNLYEFVKIDFQLLLDHNLWIDVTSNALASIGIAFGGLICISAHGTFHSNIYSMIAFLPLFNLLCDVLFTLFVYTNLVDHAAAKNVSFDEMMNDNNSLLFVKLVASLLEWPSHQQLWTIVYFLYLHIIGLRFVIFLLFTLTMALHETMHCVFYLRKVAIGSIFAIILFIMPLYISPIGYLLYRNMEDFCSSSFVSLIATFEFAGIFYMYGAKRLLTDGHFMLNKRLRLLEYLLYALPISLGIVAVFNLYAWAHTSRGYQGRWIFILQIVILNVMSALILIHFTIHVTINWRMKRQMFQPASIWGCRSAEMRRNREFFKSKTIDARFKYRQQLYERSATSIN